MSYAAHKQQQKANMERSIKPSYPKEMRELAKQNDQSLVTVDVPGLTFKGPVPHSWAKELVRVMTEFAKRDAKVEMTAAPMQSASTPPTTSRDVTLIFADGTAKRGFYWRAENRWYLANGSKRKSRAVVPVKWQERSDVK